MTAATTRKASLEKDLRSCDYFAIILPCLNSKIMLAEYTTAKLVCAPLH